MPRKPGISDQTFPQNVWPARLCQDAFPTAKVKPIKSATSSNFPTLGLATEKYIQIVVASNVAQVLESVFRAF